MGKGRGTNVPPMNLKEEEVELTFISQAPIETPNGSWMMT